MDTITQARNQIARPFHNPQHPVSVYLVTLEAEASRITMRETLRLLAQQMSGGEHNEWTYPWEEIRFQQLHAVKNKLLETQKASTVNKKLSAIKGVLKACWRLDLMDSETYRKTIDVQCAKGDSVPIGRAIDKHEMGNLFMALNAYAAEEPNAATRDAALFAIMYSSAGPRRAEIAALNVEDYNKETGEFTIRRGKGNKDRKGYLSKNNKAAVNAWVDRRGDVPGPLFCRIHRADTLYYDAAGTPVRLTPKGIAHIVAHRAAQTGMGKIMTHDFRRTVVSDLMSTGSDITIVSGLVGHKNVQTTAGYNRTTERKRQKTAQLLSVPYVG